MTYQTPAVGIPGVVDAPSGTSNTPRTQITNFDITTRSYYQVDFSKYVSSAWGSHDIKVGGGTQKTVNKVDVGYPGNGYVFVYWNAALQRNDGTTDRGQYGYYEVDDIGTRGTTGGTMNNLYIQDRWKIHPRITPEPGTANRERACSVVQTAPFATTRSPLTSRRRCRPAWASASMSSATAS